MRWALVNKINNIVENIIIWDGLNELFSNTNWNVILLTEDENTVGSGWTYDENNNPRFIEPDVLETP